MELFWRNKSALQRRIDRFVIFLFETRDHFGSRHDLADAADTLAAAPDFLPGFRLGALARGVWAGTHFRRIGLREIVGVHAGRDNRRLQIIAMHAGEEI